jgi:hypothetical protein
MRLVSFNILEGLRPITAGATERRQLDRDRADAARVVVAALTPDILVLNEASSLSRGGRELGLARLRG